ncbi:hypothetical protein LXL04_000498 [Taraxacum kok-saghyz]
MCIRVCMSLNVVLYFLLYKCNAIPNLLFGMRLSLVLNDVVLGLLYYFLVRIALIGSTINRAILNLIHISYDIFDPIVSTKLHVGSWVQRSCDRSTLFSDLAEYSTNPTPLATATATASGEGVVGESFGELGESFGEWLATTTPCSLSSLPESNRLKRLTGQFGLDKIEKLIWRSNRFITHFYKNRPVHSGTEISIKPALIKPLSSPVPGPAGRFKPIKDIDKAN